MLTPVPGGGPIDRLAGFVATLRFEDLPDDVIAKTKIHIADTLGAALAGSRSREFATARKVINRGGEARIWGTQDFTSSRDAALVNGISAHAFELDDSGGCDHSGAVVLPAVLAALPRSGRIVTGRELISAVVAGYDVGRRVLEAAGGYDRHNGLGWHSTGTCGTLAAAAAVANLWNLPAAACRDAITLATSFSSGLWGFIHDGSQAKKIHAGRAAEGGLLAAQLAAEGFAGPSKVFSDVWGGFFNAFNKTSGEPGKLAEALGEAWKIRRAVLKPYASCRGTHSAIDALEDLLSETGRRPQEIVSMELRMSEMLMNMCGKKENGPLSSTQMSLPYALAARCIFGTAGLAAYSSECRSDPRIRPMMGRMKLQIDGTMQPLDEPVVILTFSDGSRVSRMVPRATGSAERPMQPWAIEEKFRQLAGMALEDKEVTRLWDLVNSLERLDDCRRLKTLLAGNADGRPVFC
ncbi:2-methylcitrate dehydratase [Paramesorhizobium deserti]|uniref:2-methylcitrate dehydratase n=1 Tax=Paramesorhizobium deserti TaxID=1494590 RepID=A0A135HPB3_9HYPH|nr:MmgE/PrpD family protein [Paramesorhizobium deserti]KXF75057.1 2-methylcitrate dehydratase [Paramesorhizobium deserti]